MSPAPVLVIGPGALGGLLAGLLAEGGVPVRLLDRRPERARRLTERGLVISGPDQAPSRTIRVPVDCPLPDGFEPELVLLCVKARDTVSALEAARAFPTATVAVLQNGLSRADEVARILGNGDRVVGVLTTEGATREGEGRIHHAGRGPTRIGALTLAGRARVEQVRDILRQGGLDVEIADDLEQLTWEKLLVNAAINALTGLLDCPNGALLESSAAGALADEAAQEVARLATDLQVSGDWSKEAARARWRRVARDTNTNISSTLQDLRASRKTEVFAINGAVAQVGRERSQAVPINELLARLIEAREELLPRPRAERKPKKRSHG